MPAELSTNTEDYLTPAQVVPMIGGLVTEATLAKWRRTNRGPAFLPVGKGVLYYKPDVLAWLTSIRRIPNGDRKARKPVVLPVQLSGQGVPRTNRFGRHRTKQESR